MYFLSYTMDRGTYLIFLFCATILLCILFYIALKHDINIFKIIMTLSMVILCSMLYFHVMSEYYIFNNFIFEIVRYIHELLDDFHFSGTFGAIFSLLCKILIAIICALLLSTTFIITTLIVFLFCFALTILATCEVTTKGWQVQTISSSIYFRGVWDSTRSPLGTRTIASATPATSQKQKINKQLQ
jgi:hypothetical protein